MKYPPVALTMKEIEEIASFNELQGAWGKSRDEMLEILNSSPSAKFILNEENVKEVFALLPEVLDCYVPPFKIERTMDGKLCTIN